MLNFRCLPQKINMTKGVRNQSIKPDLLNTLQVFYIAASIALALGIIFTVVINYISSFNDPLINTFYGIIISAAGISIFSITALLAKSLDRFNTTLFFTIISYIYLVVFILPSNAKKILNKIIQKVGI